MKWIVLVAGCLTAVPSRAADPATARVFIASDSTAQDYGPERYPQEGWGSMLRCAFGPDVVVENRAIAARSTRSFIDEGRLDEIARDIRAGDTLLIQFGHNDANRAKPERYAAIPDYKAYLRRYIATAANVGAQAVLLTPVTRRNFVGGKVVASFPDYSDAVRAVARETGTPLIDLDALSARWIEHAGIEPSRRFFLADDTHFTELGARGVAEIVAAGLAAAALPISSHVRESRPALALTEPTGGVGCAAPVAAAPLRFRFSGRATAGEIAVAAGRAYAGGYGFEADPRLFSVRLAEGNYRVSLTLREPRAGSETTILAEQRRLMARVVGAPARRVVTLSFVVNVRTPALAPPPEHAPGGGAVRLDAREQGALDWDDKLTLAFLGAAPQVSALTIEPIRAPTIFLLGDSTVTDQAGEPYASWGQMLPVFVHSDVAVANHASAGQTLKSFQAELRLDKVLETMRPGDVALIQFGHNDQKISWPQTYAAAATTYRQWLRTYVEEVRLHGGTPVLVTPPERRMFTPAGRIRPNLADYAEAMRAVATEEKAPLIDLNAASIRLYEALGPDRAAHAFVRGDATHHDDYGAYVLARAVADGLARAGAPLAALLAPNLPPFDPARPIAPEQFHPIGGAT